MRISFIGAGRVAHHLAKALQARHQIVQIYSRTYEHADVLAQAAGAEAAYSFSALKSEIDLLIIAVSDSAIADVIQAVHPYLPNTLIVHTSGSTGISKLTQAHARAGVLYPLQTFSLEREIDWTQTPLFIEAAEPQDLMMLSTLASELSQRVYPYSSAQRLSLHLAAVYACNFANYCYDMAKQIVDEQQVDFSLLYPLMLETAQKAAAADPKTMQTGPAMRGDQNIIAMHTLMLEQANRPDLKQVYALLSEQILQRHQPEQI
ncbi:Rossmann-like and DUF2520 domain-containing protein [Acinetobacter pragensis]|uniref:F420-dependent NADP oxidoreductase n=1 Tax=Acinetobacter pragensis TaxID=1806892 RepID=A0A151XZV3_9GAMM|nr:Rossmann-like and DUF2520 domain-containing protein [Acinetobacter pragensis]KYQ71317.1 F420-dependent NADP oxidoreductase [Acinetobacter pragensis]